MLNRTWRYLRYIHLRDALSRVHKDISTVGIVGAGHGYSEVALALEFPNIEFYLTDIIAPNYPNYHKAMDICWKWGISNVKFGIWNVLEPTSHQFDLVCSTEVLEHIEDAETAAKAMILAAKKFIYCLVPFSDPDTNADTKKRARALEQFGHFVYGYDAYSLEKLFPNPLFINGAYFDDAGQILRQKLTELSNIEIDDQMHELIEFANLDIQNRMPLKPKQGQGIKILSKV